MVAAQRAAAARRNQTLVAQTGQSQLHCFKGQMARLGDMLDRWAAKPRVRIPTAMQMREDAKISWAEPQLIHPLRHEKIRTFHAHRTSLFWIADSARHCASSRSASSACPLARASSAARKSSFMRRDLSAVMLSARDRPGSSPSTVRRCSPADCCVAAINSPRLRCSRSA
ncbi:MAG: hypothetical protein QG602_423 [Verrucomicrobiota bacterium]|nr:hypothetical protein [Verrucomicrobiota bacterium]